MTLRLVIAGALAAAVLAGCGGGEELQSSGPVAAATPSATPYSTKVTGLDTQPRVRYSASVRRRLDAGGVGVVDFVARAGVEPETLQVNKEQTLQELRWSDWGTDHATGRARVRMLVCDPNCARGRIAVADGKIELSEVKVCGSRRFYAKAALETTDPDTGQASRPATYLRTPC